MAERSKGPRSKTRHKFQKKLRQRGRPPVTHSLRSFNAGDHVAIVVNPSVHKGQPHSRFHGQTGVVEGRRGTSFVVRVRMGGKYKTVVARPEHLQIHKASQVGKATPADPRVGGTGSTAAGVN